MKKYSLAALSLCTFALLAGCNDKQPISGKACLGTDNDSLVESMQEQCKAGDAIATKNPAYFCDFNYSITYNAYNSAMCIYTGALKPERIEK